MPFKVIQNSDIDVREKGGKIEIYDGRKGIDGRPRGDLTYLTPDQAEELVEDIEQVLEEINSSSGDTNRS